MNNISRFSFISLSLEGLFQLRSSFLTSCYTFFPFYFVSIHFCMACMKPENGGLLPTLKVLERRSSIILGCEGKMEREIYRRQQDRAVVEEGAEPEGKASDIPAELRSNPHRRS